MEFKIGKKGADHIKAGSLLFMFEQDNISVKIKNKQVVLPVFSEAIATASEEGDYIFTGSLNNIDCYAVETVILPDGFKKVPCRSLLPSLTPPEFTAFARARELVQWHNNNVFCSRCGKTLDTDWESYAKKCNHCFLEIFPRISPAVIVAVIKDRSILLAHNNHFPAGLYSLIAGFVDAGESLEETVQREIHEEVGIEVDRIEYFGSQTWPFPNSLMIGFTARYKSGELTPDGREIHDARWYTPSALPQLPLPVSIARKIIDSVCERI